MQTTGSAGTAARGGEETVRVWDIFVRVFHWTVFVAFFVAFFTEDDLLTLHVWAGYLVGALVLLRLIWGVIGTRNARFSDFVYKPATVLRYSVNLLLFRSKRYVGHSPAGGAMVIALLVSLAVTVVTGMANYGASKKAGPLAPLFAQGAIMAPPFAPSFALVSAARAEDDEHEGSRGDRRREGGAWREVHELFANLTMLLVILHIAGVLVASVAHRENLPRAMITGRKRP
jgi:cytochrome b